MAHVVTFGEIMLRLSPPGAERFFQTPSLTATFGGGEANVAVSLAHFGVDSVFVSVVPPHAIGAAVVAALRAEGVRTDAILRSGDRLGVYFAETGASQRPSQVIYDRAHSAISEMAPDAIDWHTVVQGAAWFHVTGITPALGAGPAGATELAIDAARRAGARVSLDLNYRRKLWPEADAQRAMRPLVTKADVVIANEEDLQAALGITVPNTDVVDGRLSLDGYRHAAECVSRQFGVRIVAITLRESVSASDNGWRAVLWDADAGRFYVSQSYAIRVIDRIGAGDSFAAGLIFGLLARDAPEAALKFAVAASALKHTIPGDFNRVTVAEVRRLAEGDGSGRVVR